MTNDLPAEVSEFLVNALESHDDQRVQVTKTDEGSILEREKEVRSTHDYVCGKEKRHRRRLLREGKSGRNRFFTARITG
jgi:hypothetical protein